MSSFSEARRTAASVLPLDAVSFPLGRAVGCVLAEPLHALLDIPHAATSAMDGWALAEPLSPNAVTPDASTPNAVTPDANTALSWRNRPDGAEGPGTLLAPLPEGEAVGVVTGSPVPEGTVSVLRSEHAQLAGEILRVAEDKTPDLEPGRNIRPRGAEAHEGDLLLDAGHTLTAAGAAAAAVAGYDALRVIPRPRARLILTGGEVITAGIPGPGQVRDVFGLALPPMLAEAGAELDDIHRIDDDHAAMERLLGERHAEGTSPDLIITTGGTADSRADTLRPALEQLGAEILVGSVDMRPGHPALLAQLPATEDAGPAYVLGLPGNPLAGFAALTVLGVPLLAALAGREPPVPLSAAAAGDIPGPRRGVRLVPAQLRDGRIAPMEHFHAHMMRGLAAADVFAVVPSGGVPAGGQMECLRVLGRSLQENSMSKRRAGWGA